MRVGEAERIVERRAAMTVDGAAVLSALPFDLKFGVIPLNRGTAAAT